MDPNDRFYPRKIYTCFYFNKCSISLYTIFVVIYRCISVSHDQSKTYWESPEISPGLICGKTHLSEHKIDQICKTLVLLVGQGPTSGDCHIINMANGLICVTVSPQTTP